MFQDIYQRTAHVIYSTNAVLTEHFIITFFIVTKRRGCYYVEQIWRTFTTKCNEPLDSKTLLHVSNNLKNAKQFANTMLRLDLRRPGTREVLYYSKCFQIANKKALYFVFNKPRKGVYFYTQDLDTGAKEIVLIANIVHLNSAKRIIKEQCNKYL